MKEVKTHETGKVYLRVGDSSKYTDYVFTEEKIEELTGKSIASAITYLNGLTQEQLETLCKNNRTNTFIIANIKRVSIGS
jgi:hypothetical protein